MASIKSPSSAAFSRGQTPLKKMHTTLKENLARLMQSQADTNQTGLTISPAGWGITFQTSDLGENEVMVINKDGILNWADGDWNETTAELAAEFIADNLEQWLRSSNEDSDIDALLDGAFSATEGGAE